MGNNLEHVSGTFGDKDTDFHIRNIEGQSKAEIYGKNIYISGNIEGKSNVTLHASGTIVIGRIEGKSTVQAFGEKVFIRGRIEGQSKLLAYCKELLVGGTIEGQSYVGYSTKGKFSWGIKGNSIFTKMEDVHVDNTENVREAVLLDADHHNLPVADIVDVDK